MSSIVTFYSYKGGVGRSMALANIAVLLARRGRKVLVVDWDLEAPGLERYFSYFEIKGGGGAGLLRMCMEARDNGSADYTKFTSTFECEAPHPITLLASGRETDESYTRNLEAFDWEAFFAASGGGFVEDLRHRWRDDFDVVLIDSRTGLSDTGGICTIQLPDIVVGMFTANFQSLYGVRDVMRLAQKARQSLAYDRMPLSILPLPTRWGVQEFQETQVWLDRVTEAVQEFFADWLPSGVKPRDVIEAIKVPQRDFFGFGERLAVVEQGTTDPSGMGFVYDKIAAFIASDFADVGALIGEQKAKEAAQVATPRTSGSISTTVEPPDYRYDIFVSYDKTMTDYVLEFVEGLKAELAALLPAPPRVFIDVQEIRAGELWADTLSDALVRSKVLLAFVTPRYVSSRYAPNEFRVFADRGRTTLKSLVVPVIVRGEDFPEYIREVTWIDVRRYPLFKASTRRTQMQHEIQRVASILADLVAKAPPFDAHWLDQAKVVYGESLQDADASAVVDSKAKP